MISEKFLPNNAGGQGFSIKYLFSEIATHIPLGSTCELLVSTFEISKTYRRIYHVAEAA